MIDAMNRALRATVRSLAARPRGKRIVREIVQFGLGVQEVNLAYNDHRRRAWTDERPFSVLVYMGPWGRQDFDRFVHALDQQPEVGGHELPIALPRKMSAVVFHDTAVSADMAMSRVMLTIRRALWEAGVCVDLLKAEVRLTEDVEWRA